MSDRVRELAARQVQLQERCAAQRASMADEVTSIEVRFSSVDRIVGFARGTLLHPAVIVAAVVALLMVGRLRGFQLLGRALLLAAAARRLILVARKI